MQNYNPSYSSYPISYVPSSCGNATSRKILIASRKGTRPNYVNAFSEYGMLCDEDLHPQSIKQYDGLLLPGGGDMEPSLYGEDNTTSKNIDPDCDIQQLELLSEFFAAGKPVMGICRGIQVINVYFGGTLHQHLSDATSHESLLTGDNDHDVYCSSDSFLHLLYGSNFHVNSAHHQGIRKLGHSLISQAQYHGTIEAIRHINAPVFGVQWHPERMCLNFGSALYVDGGLLLNYFYRLL